MHLETATCPWSGSPLWEHSEFAVVGTKQVAVRKGKEDHETRCDTISHANQRSIHIPGWSYMAGDYTCCDMVVKIKDCKKSEDPTMPKPKPTPPSSIPEGTETLTHQKTVLSVSKPVQEGAWLCKKFWKSVNLRWFLAHKNSWEARTQGTGEKSEVEGEPGDRSSSPFRSLLVITCSSPKKGRFQRRRYTCDLKESIITC